MSDMTPVIAAKSDQLNADDLIAGPRTITITRVDVRPGTEQPVTVHFEGDNRKPWKPCKTTCRVMVAAWGADSSKYVGRSATIYREPKVTWGGMETGGIRISHLSHIDAKMVVVTQEKKGKRTPTTILPLRSSRSQPSDATSPGATADPAPVAPGADPQDAGSEAASTDRDKHYAWLNDRWADINQAETLDDLDAIARKAAKGIARMREAGSEDLADKFDEALAKRRAELAGVSDADVPY